MHDGCRHDTAWSKMGKNLALTLVDLEWNLMNQAAMNNRTQNLSLFWTLILSHVGLFITFCLSYLKFKICLKRDIRREYPAYASKILPPPLRGGLRNVNTQLAPVWSNYNSYCQCLEYFLTHLSFTDLLSLFLQWQVRAKLLCHKGNQLFIYSLSEVVQIFIIIDNNSSNDEDLINNGAFVDYYCMQMFTRWWSYWTRGRGKSMAMSNLNSWVGIWNSFVRCHSILNKENFLSSVLWIILTLKKISQ